MKLLFTLLALVSFGALANNSKFECKYLDYHLSLDVGGFEHVIHDLRINGKISIKELIDGSWFIESVGCKKSGFEITASHIQYNDPTRKIFTLIYSAKKGYVLTGI